MGKKLKTLYEYLGITKEEYEKYVVPTLDAKEASLIRKRYGTDLDNPITEVEFSSEDTKRFYGNLIPKLKRRLIKAGVITDSKEKKEDTQASGDAPQRRRRSKKNATPIVVEGDESIGLNDSVASNVTRDMGSEVVVFEKPLEDKVGEAVIAEESEQLLISTSTVTEDRNGSSEVVILEDEDNTTFQLLEEISDVSEPEFDEFIAELTKECEEIEARISAKLQKLDVSITLSDRRARLLEREAQIDREIASRLANAKSEDKGVTKKL